MLKRSQQISAVIVTFRTGPAIFECIESVLGQPEVIEVVVVNNGNPRADTERLVKICAAEPRLTLVEPGRNIGFASGCNLGVSHTRGNFIALINPDCWLEAETMRRLLDVFDTHADAWICGCRLLNADGSEQRGGRRDILTPWHAMVEVFRLYRLFPNHPTVRRFHLHESEPIYKVEEVPTVSGAFMVMRRRHYQRLGGMDDNMFLHVDDSDICLRTASLGGKVYYCGHISVRHHRSTSDVAEIFIQWHKTRSMNYYFYKHFAATYPRWFLHFGALALWIRFAVSLPGLILSDLPNIVRRRQDGNQHGTGATDLGRRAQ